ncbi:MAG: inositol monophosphatase family protein [Pseudomonadota bacterium]
MQDPSLSTDLALAQSAALRAGRALREKREAWGQVTETIGRDVKAAGDKAAETIILTMLRELSSHPILSEEEGWLGDEAGRDALHWVVDPLDGTGNYVRDVPICCVSIGLMRGSQPVIGAVYDFNRDELISGEVGVGAWLNDRPVKVSTVADKRAGTVGTGFTVRRDYSQAALSAFAEFVAPWRKVRMIGAAALSMAYVGAGRFDAHQESSTMIWDVAAGAAIVEAAGGRVDIQHLDDTGVVDVYADNGLLPS